MGRRIEVELTSSRDDGSWTWRAAGAKKPKGEVEGSLLYDNAQVGDVVKVEAEFHLDGIEITEVFAPKAKKERSNLLELKTRPLRDDELVTTQRVSKSERGGGEGRGRGRGRGDRGNDRGDRGDRGNRGERKGGSGNRGGERRGPKPEEDRRPRPKRLRPRRVHRDAMLASVTEEHRPIVEQVIKDGMPGVRAAIEKQNAEAKEAGKPEVDARPIMSIAEKNLSKARLAEWRDRADAALADAEELDIRDLRSVVVAGADVARDDESRAIADQIKATLDRRLETDHAAWLADLDNAVTEARVVRGLRLSSRPVKAGAPLPTEIASKLAQQASEALASDVMQDRWATVLDALAFSPVRGAVTPVSVPAEPGEELLAEVRRLSDRIPAIAALFNIDPAQVPKSAKRRRPPRKDVKGKDDKGKPAGRPDRKSDGGGGKGDRPARADSKGGRRGEQDRKPKDPSATKPNARPVPGAEKPVEPEPEVTVEDAPEAIDGESTATETVETEATEAEAVETAAPEAEAAAPEAEPEPEAAAPEAAAPKAEAAPEAEAPEAAADEPAADPQPEPRSSPGRVVARR
ncbi:MAG: hypothetical protein ACRBK7_31265 [Acidimicrobiales bacterium]